MRFAITLFFLATLVAHSRAQRFADAISPSLGIPYADSDNPRQALDLYLPKNPSDTRPLPVICFVHGRAWRAGNKKGGRNHLAPFMASGHYAGISIAYRLTGEARETNSRT